MALMAVFLSSSRWRASRLDFCTMNRSKSRPTKVATMISSIMVKPFFCFISFIITYFVI